MVLMTAFSTALGPKDLELIGTARVLAKPVDLNDLLALVRDVMGEKSGELLERKA